MMGREFAMDTVFELFFEEGQWGGSSEGSCGARGCDPHGGAAVDSDDDDDEMTPSGGDSGDERKAFWETQRHLLQEALSRTSSSEMKIRRRTEDAAEKMRSPELLCNCSGRRMMAVDCRNCALTHVVQKLQEAGYNSALCKSKWRRSPDVPSGEHSYVDVVTEGKNGQKCPIRVVIELNFRAEFEMARGSREYNSLVNRLPELFVGKAEKLKAVVKIMCAAAKKCMKDNKMHMAPWRKNKYMQSKWLGTPERTVPRSISFAPTTTTTTTTTAAVSAGQPKFRASMLTFDLHRTAVEVV